MSEKEKYSVMKKELVPYDYYYETNGQSAMMVANGHAGLHPMHHPYNLEENFLHILGKNPKCHQYLKQFFLLVGGATSASPIIISTRC